MEERGMDTQYKLFKSSGAPKSTVHSIVCGRTQNIGIETIFALAQRLGVGLREFFNREIFDDENVAG